MSQWAAKQEDSELPTREDIAARLEAMHASLAHLSFDCEMLDEGTTEAGEEVELHVVQLAHVEMAPNQTHVSVRAPGSATVVYEWIDDGNKIHEWARGQTLDQTDRPARGRMAYLAEQAGIEACFIGGFLGSWIFPQEHSNLARYADHIRNADRIVKTSEGGRECYLAEQEVSSTDSEATTWRRLYYIDSKCYGIIKRVLTQTRHREDGSALEIVTHIWWYENIQARSGAGGRLPDEPCVPNE